MENYPVQNFTESSMASPTETTEINDLNPRRKKRNLGNYNLYNFWNSCFCCDNLLLRVGCKGDDHAKNFYPEE